MQTMSGQSGGGAGNGLVLHCVGRASSRKPTLRVPRYHKLCAPRIRRVSSKARETGNRYIKNLVSLTEKPTSSLMRV